MNAVPLGCSFRNAMCTVDGENKKILPGIFLFSIQQGETIEGEFVLFLTKDVFFSKLFYSTTKSGSNQCDAFRNSSAYTVRSI